MDYHKLRIDKFSTFNGMNIPDDFNPGLSKEDNAEVLFMFVASNHEVMNALNYVQNYQTHKDNRVFFVFKKGIKQFGRDHVYNLVMKHGSFKRKAPMLCSLSKVYSAFAFMYEV